MTELTMENPAFVKAELCTRGVQLDLNTRAWVASCASAHDPILSDGIELLLPSDLWVRAPVLDEAPVESPYVLTGVDEQLVLRHEQASVDVRLVPQPEYYSRLTTGGTPMWKVGTVQGGFVAIMPHQSCSFALRGQPCPLCLDGQVASGPAGLAVSVEEVTEVVQAAFAEGAAEFVYFNLGAVATEDGGLRILEPYIRAIKAHFDTMVAVQLHPPSSDHWIDRAYGLGVDAISYSLDVFDGEISRRLMPGRIERIGRERYFEALGYAATVFPSGTVWSELVVGLEPPSSTDLGIDALTRLGVLPVLTLLDSKRLRSLGARPAAPTSEIIPVYRHLFQVVRDARINMGWVRDLSSAITPLEGRFFSGEDARMTVALQQFYRSRLGGLTARNLARLRRRLRVRQVSDSFDSSHL